MEMIEIEKEADEIIKKVESCIFYTCKKNNYL